MIVVTGATGHLGRLVVAALLETVPARELAVAVRDPEKAHDLAARGITVRRADYDAPETLAAAFAGAEKVLLISSTEIGRRERQHRAAIDAAKRAGVSLIAYTSVLHAEHARHTLAAEHKATERALAASGVPYVILRNGWYTENYTEQLAGVRAHGTFVGSAGTGRIAAATRADYAAAAAAVLTQPGHAGKTYELAGDTDFSMVELAAEVARQLGTPVAYQDLSQAEHTAALEGFGLPPALAEALSSADAGIARGELNDASKTLSRLIGRPTTPLSVAVAQATG